MYYNDVDDDKDDDNKHDDDGDLYGNKHEDESLEVEVESPCASPQAAAAGCEFLRKYQLMLKVDFPVHVHARTESEF